VVSGKHTRKACHAQPDVIEFYPQIKLLHVACVLLSGSVFAFRGLLMLGESALSNHPTLKWLSYINDSILLTAGLLLMQITRQYPIAHYWLSVKLALLVVYIALGIFALRLGRTYATRAACFATALGVYLFMFSVARSHHPFGLLGS
jgi:uncharacterized membrane protein SirB2